MDYTGVLPEYKYPAQVKVVFISFKAIKDVTVVLSKPNVPKANARFGMFSSHKVAISEKKHIWPILGF